MGVELAGALRRYLGQYRVRGYGGGTKHTKDMNGASWRLILNVRHAGTRQKRHLATAERRKWMSDNEAASAKEERSC